MPDSMDATPPVATELSEMRALITKLDNITNTVDSAHEPLGDLRTDVTDEQAVEVLLARARSCVATVIQRGGPNDLRDVAVAVGSSLRGRQPDATPETLWARLDELAQIPGIAANRVGHSAVDQTLRGWNGKSQAVVNLLNGQEGGLRRAQIVSGLDVAGMSIGDSSALSKILRELDDAGLIRRWKEGREVVAELTAVGRKHAHAPLPGPSVVTADYEKLIPTPADSGATRVIAWYERKSSVARLARLAA